MNRRLCSMWSWRAACYRYYAAPSLLDDGDVPAPPRTSPAVRPPLGDPPEQLLRDLPAGSIYVGCGVRARGEIVRPRQGPA